MTALIIGATGLVGSELLKLLLEDPGFKEVRIFTRRPVQVENPKLKTYVVDFENIASWQENLAGDILFSALGTTIKKAGSKAEQYKVDFTYQLEVARAAYRNRVENYVLVSSLGANPRSGIFYTRMKGELDEAIRSLKFRNTVILRPATLIGERSEKRVGESIVVSVTQFMAAVLPTLRKYRPIPASTVARAMRNLGMEKHTGFRIIDNPEIFKLATE